MKGKETKNNNGERIIDTCIANDLVIANDKLKHKEIHKCTREVHRRKEKSLIDYFPISRQKSKYIKSVKVSRQAEIGSNDYYLVEIEMRHRECEKSEKIRNKTKNKIRSYELKDSNQ